MKNVSVWGISVIIVRCSHCRGLMKVDDSRLPSDGQGRVRCPHCGRICAADESRDLSDRLEAAWKDSEREVTSSPAQQSKLDDESPPAPSGRPIQASEVAAQSRSDDDDFLFPAEQGGKRLRKRSLSLGGRVVVWTVLSLSVMVFFALLVNILLPGPPTGTFSTGIGRKQEAPVNALDSRMGNDRKASGAVPGSPRQ